MHSEHFSRYEDDGNNTNDPADDSSKLGDVANDEENSPTEGTPTEKSSNTNNDAMESALGMEEIAEDEQVEQDTPMDEDCYQHFDQTNGVTQQELSSEFVAEWIRKNFPGVVSEAELQSQAVALETDDHGEGNTSPDHFPAATTTDMKTPPHLCEECSIFNPAFVCEDCNLALCFRCTDAIHIIPSFSAHGVRFCRINGTTREPTTQPEACVDGVEASVVSTATAVPKTLQVTIKHMKEPRLSFSTGMHIFFRALDCARWPRELLHGTLVSRGPATASNGETFYHRVLWLRGVEALPNGFFRAALVLPGWEISSDNEGDIGETFWPHEIGVFPTQLGALRAVVTAEQIARAKFRRELAGERIHRWRRFHLADYDDIVHGSEAFPSSEILDEIVAETEAALGAEFGVRLTRQDDDRFHQELAQGTWNSRKWMETIGRGDNLREEDAVPFEYGVASTDAMYTFGEELETPMPTPWAPASRIRLFMIAENDVVFPERICRQHLRTILEQLLFVYAGFAWRLWREFVDRHRVQEEQQNREHAACVLQAWTRRVAERKRQKERQLLLSMAIGSSIDALELYRRRQIEARKLYAFLTRQIEEKKRRSLRKWRLAVGPSDPPPPPAISWHPSHGMKGMLPKLPRIGARRRTAQDAAVAPGSQVIIEDMATYKLFRANHAGPADTSYWIIRARILAGTCPIGPAFREARRLVSRTDFATSVLLQQISVFVCLMEPEELGTMETAAGGDSSMVIEYSYERQVRTKYRALCIELKSAQTITKRHVELAQQSLVEFDGAAANAAAASIGGSGTMESKKRRASLSMQQLRDEDAAEDAKMNEAREVLAQKLQLAEQQAAKATHELTRLGMMQIEFLYFPIEHDGVPDSEKLLAFLEGQIESRLRAGKNLYIFSRLGHGRTGLVSALLLGRVYGITASEALERAQRTHDCQRPGAPRGLSFCSPTTASQLAFVRRMLARSMDPIYAPLVLENSSKGFRSTRVQQRGLLAEPFLRDEGFMISVVGDAQAREREAFEQNRLERIARRESTAAALQQERRKQKLEHEIMEIEERADAVHAVITSVYDKLEQGNGS